MLNPVATHQAASIDTHSTRLLVAGCAIKHTTKIVVEVVTQGQAAQFTGVRACQGRSSVSGSLVYGGKIFKPMRQGREAKQERSCQRENS